MAPGSPNLEVLGQDSGDRTLKIQARFGFEPRAWRPNVKMLRQAPQVLILGWVSHCVLGSSLRPRLPQM